MNKLVIACAFGALSAATLQPAAAQQVAPATGSASGLTAATLAARLDTARTQLCPIINSLRLNDRQALAIEELLVAEAVAPQASPERTQTLQLIMTATRYERSQRLK